ncbi:hypothetical protein G6F40_014797 [Rhizopus arrhizus]|nr:hypothetical protein G6F40_014797 [Rhizopus arrhizus]
MRDAGPTEPQCDAALLRVVHLGHRRPLARDLPDRSCLADAGDAGRRSRLPHHSLGLGLPGFRHRVLGADPLAGRGPSGFLRPRGADPADRLRDRRELFFRYRAGKHPADGGGRPAAMAAGAAHRRGLAAAAGDVRREFPQQPARLAGAGADPDLHPGAGGDHARALPDSGGAVRRAAAVGRGAG